ncbi:MAG: enoyl-CoA hydratase/isomerase family protein [Synergistaceae bacterium]|nr:enoyl-CoA hydratase/isomerase family protein [Synergistaceae bacterium]
MGYQNIEFKVSDKIATIALNTPKNFNAFTEELLADLGNILDQCADDEGIRVLVICGEGRSFCSGGDVDTMRRSIENRNTQSLIRIVRSAGNIARKIRAIRKPVIASLHGVVASDACSLALLCDFRVASDDVLFMETFMNIGLVPDMGYTYVLSRYIGFGRLTEFLMTSKMFTADMALDMGMLNILTTRENLSNETMAYAKRLVALPQDTVALTKALINQTLFSGLDACLDREAKYQDLLLRSENYIEGVEAFLEKRPAAFNKPLKEQVGR